MRTGPLYFRQPCTTLFLFVVFSILFYALKVGVAAWGNKERTDKEAPSRPRTRMCK